MFVKEAFAEIIGTFFLVFFICGAIIVNSLNGDIVGHVGISLVCGFVVTAIVLAIGHISGAHVNPAVTIALAVTNRLGWKRVPIYIVAQIAGAILASLLLKFLVGEGGTIGMTLPAGSVMQSLLMEITLTATLLFVVLAVATDPRANAQLASIAIGATIAIDVFVGGPISGASMNPARSLGPALVAGELEHLWLYIVGPIVGACVGAFAYLFVGQKNNPKLKA
jgi:aquaporin NIP